MSCAMMRGLIATVALFFWSLGELSAQPLVMRTQDPQAGSRVFGSKGCILCHAVSGVGGKIGPDLGRIAGPRSFHDLAAAMWNHLPGVMERMRWLGISRSRLTPQETADLIAFLFTLNYFDETGNLEAGQRLFTEKKCVVCHQIGGTGGVVGPNLDSLSQYGSPIFVAAAMWNHGPAMAMAMGARGIQRPIFRAGELLDLVAYLKSVAPGANSEPLYLLPGKVDEGRRLFVAKQCSECHSVGGQGGRIGPELGEQARQKNVTEFAARMWNKAPAMMRAMQEKEITIPQIRAEEMADLVAYLNSVRYFGSANPDKGRELLFVKRCLSCHSFEGRGGRNASDLAKSKGLDSPAATLSALWNHSFISQSPTEPLWPRWPRFLPQEMADLLAFLEAIGQSP